MSAEIRPIDTIQKKVINTTSRVVPMYSQIRALKLLMKAKKKIIGTKRPQIKFIDRPLPDVNSLALDSIDTSNPFLSHLWP